ncbi:MAG: PIN domain-containing protein [Deltaproteobacteria bacterium]|nr:PIN domain-containing protein [Deltaproteobacteria bacterium]
MRVYVDASIVLRGLLSGDRAMSKIAPTDEVGTSDLLEIECKRVLQRERLESHLDDRQYSESLVLLDSLLDHLFVIALGPAVKRRATEPFPTVIGTLDAIHLASAILWRDAEPSSKLRILTYDRQLALCAQAMGIQTGPQP